MFYELIQEAEKFLCIELESNADKELKRQLLEIQYWLPTEEIGFYFVANKQIARIIDETKQLLKNNFKNDHRIG